MSDKYTLIAAEYAANMAAPAADAPTLTKMCLWIGVSKSGFYDWKGVHSGGCRVTAVCDTP